MRSATRTLLAGLWAVLSVTAVEARERVYYYHNDHLGTPQAMSNAAGSTVWEAEYEPFGKATVNEDPDGDGMPVTNNLRCPGQYYDAETGLHYNYHRDYQPETGRYLQPDPIGVYGLTMLSFTATDPTGFASGDTNLYAYSMSNPVNFIDPLGLWGEDVHYDMTHSWALALGFTPSQAERLARADNGTDGGYGSWMPLLGDQSRHFNQGGGKCDSRSAWAETEYQRALGYYRAGKFIAALGHLGRGLHSLQDIDPHRDWDTGASGTARHPDWYDSWNDPRNSAARAGTEQKTLEYLRRFLSAAPGLR